MTELTHLCLVSAQATPNLTPVLDPAVAPRRVILLVSPDMRERAHWLEAVLSARGIPVARWSIDDAWDVEHVQTRVLELLEREREAVAASTIALNATGGTKPMSIAAYEAFRAYDLPIFYVHPERDRLIWMSPAGRNALDLANRLALGPFLVAHGARVLGGKTEGIPPRLRGLTDWLVANVRTLGDALGGLNYLANAAKEDLVSPEMDARQLRDQRLQALIDRFAAEGLLRPSGRRLRFPDPDARFYVNGGWLEEHVFDLLRNLRGELPQIQDLARSLEIVRASPRGEEIPNEIDCACLAENRLYIVECKTRTWRREGGGADALYRLDTLGDLLGGLQARTMLVSYRQLPPHDLRRAADLRVQVCAGPRLLALRGALRAWIGEAPA
jgi:hypothetical protein